MLFKRSVAAKRASRCQDHFLPACFHFAQSDFYFRANLINKLLVRHIGLHHLQAERGC